MADLVMDIVRAQVAASLMIVLVLVLRRPVRRLVGPRIAYALWLLPLVGAAAMLMPTPVKVVYIHPAPLAAVASLPATTTTIPAHAGERAAASAVKAPIPVDPWRAAVTVWLAGVAVSLGVLLVQQARYLGFARRGAAGPAVVGFWRPRVVLPVDFEERYSPDEQALILEHEAAHLRRQDPRAIGLALIFRSLAWFNPLAYVALDKLRIDQELACDEAVVSRFPKARRSYAETLAKTQLAIRPLPLGCYWPSGTEHPFLERLAMLKTSRISGRNRLAGACALAVLCLGAGLAARAASPAHIRYVAAPSVRAEAPLLAPAQAAHGLSIVAPAPTAKVTARVAAVEAEQAPAPAPRPAPVIPDVYNGLANINLNAPVTVSGTIEKVEWVNPQTVIHVRDAAGEEHIVLSGTPNSLIRAGGSRDGLAIGTPITAEGYASLDGRMMTAHPIAMTSNGAPLFPQAAEQMADAQRLAEIRKAVCGARPQLPAGAAPEERVALGMWESDCEAKILASMPPRGGGQVIGRSVFTNSVVRQGDPRAAAPK